jgi:pyruvate/2-oxoglutarate dehydrogenase complex dihydrolipoamide dehydrogenase (E3) component
MGHEAEQGRALPAAARILVVGGGPAGMEAARAATNRGHQVTLIERSMALGGQLRLAADFPSKPEFGRLLKYYQASLARSPVEVILNTEADVRLLEGFEVDRLVVATGAIPRPLALVEPATHPRICQALEILEKRTPLGGDIIIVGGGLLGLDTAEFLSPNADRVTVFEAGRHVADELEWNVRRMRLKSLKARGVRIVEQTRLVRLDGHSAIYRDREEVEHAMRADAVVLALGLVPYNPLGDAGPGLPFEVTLIGDCRHPGGITAAVSQGRVVGSG